MRRPTPRTTRTDTLVPYTTLVRSGHGANEEGANAKAKSDQDDVVGDGERADDAVEREGSVEDLEIEEGASTRTNDRAGRIFFAAHQVAEPLKDRKSTRLNSSH